jgi:hypothetical protein
MKLDIWSLSRTNLVVKRHHGDDDDDDDDNDDGDDDDDDDVMKTIRAELAGVAVPLWT